MWPMVLMFCFCLIESPLDQGIFEQWQEDNNLFISTKACKEVENKAKSQNLVIVVGHLGSGKSAIIQHIALEYRSQGWIVKPIKRVTEITKAYSSREYLENKTLFVLNDPIGKESLDEILYSLWKTHEESLNVCLKKVKILLSCRKHVLNSVKVKGIFRNESNIVDISNKEFKLTYEEKIKIWNSHSSNKKLSEEELADLVQFETYFPLLCKLYFTNERNQKQGWRFFKEPVDVFEEEIRQYREAFPEKYCALVLLVFFNNSLCINDIRKKEISEEKFKHALDLCGLKKNTPYTTIGNSLESLNDFFVKKIGDTYHFYHDFLMEVTTFVLGTDFPADIIQYADIGFLRRSVKLEGCNKDNERFTIYLSDSYVSSLGKRLLTDIFSDRLLDVVLNPCLRNENVINVFIKEIGRSDKTNMLLKMIKLRTGGQKNTFASKKILLSKLAFLNLRKRISPIFALIVFNHTDFSLHCLKSLKQVQIYF